jgi:hypothetical protein
LIAAIEIHQAKLGRTPRLVAADAGFYSAKNEAAAKAKGVKRVCIPNRSTKSTERKREQKKRWFRNGQKWRTGCDAMLNLIDTLILGIELPSAVVNLRGVRAPAGDSCWRRQPRTAIARLRLPAHWRSTLMIVRGENLARCNPMRACHLRRRSVRPRRLRHDPQLLFPAPAPAPFNRCDHLDRRMPIVTISTALRAISGEKQGTRQKMLTSVP